MTERKGIFIVADRLMAGLSPKMDRAKLGIVALSAKLRQVFLSAQF